MCGFVGIRRFDGAPVDPILLRDLSDRLAHRGPDGSGTWIGEGVGLAHRRLAIIDPTGSPQPATSADGRAHVCFNGEILNYRELRASLEYPFQTGGDTEVLLALHRARGPVGAEELRGQFAYALHDEVDGVTWLVRDRLGILPLFLLRTDAFVAFASEAKALIPLLSGGASVDEGALDAYLTRRAVPGPQTLYRGIEKVLPGRVVRITTDGGVSMERYWSLPDADEVEEGVGRPEAVSRVGSALEEAVRANLVADVPVGTYLSGGVDSSLITALVTRVKGRGVHTFAAGFGDPRVDELVHARAVSDHLGTHHTEVEVGPTDFEAEWRRLTWHRDAPLSEPADLAVHQLAVAASETVKVVLSGEGSDELFGGYPKHRFARPTAWAGVVPGSLRGLAARATERLPATPTARRLGVMTRALAAPTEAERVEAWFSPFTAEERRELLGAAPPDRVAPERGGDPLRRMLVADAGPWLADNLLERGDRMTMAASVELRPPFLDHPLVELAFRLPSGVKVHHRSGKWVVKEVARPLLPPGIVDRPKAGFRVPLDAWFRDGLRDFARDHLLGPSSFASSVFDRRAVEGLLDRHDTGQRDEAIRIWTLVGLEIWHDACIKDAQVGVPSRPRVRGPASPGMAPRSTQ